MTSERITNRNEMLLHRVYAHAKKDGRTELNESERKYVLGIWPYATFETPIYISPEEAEYWDCDHNDYVRVINYLYDHGCQDLDKLIDFKDIILKGAPSRLVFRNAAIVAAFKSRNGDLDDRPYLCDNLMAACAARTALPEDL